MRMMLLKNFLRSKGVIIGLVILFLLGLVSLNIGKQFLDRNKEIVEKASVYEREHSERYLKNTKGDLGLLLYYVRFGLLNEMPNLTGLSIGLRDINSSIKNVTIRNLEEQKYTSELVNPFYQLLGDMDFSFVLIYFFPLIIIAFCFNLISEEKETGTWNLLLSQSTNPLGVFKTKLYIRYGCILSVLLLLLIIAKFYLNIIFDVSFVVYSLIAILYVSFWFALCWLLSSFNRESYENILYLLLIWVLFAVVIPAGINSLVTKLYPVPESYQTLLKSREGYHTKWDLEKEPTMQKFYEQYPQFSEYKHPDGEAFSWVWYYAMQQMGDVESHKEATELKEKLRQRVESASYLGFLFAPVHTQLTLSSIALSDMTNYLNFIERLEKFHEEKRLHFYPKIFKDNDSSSENWNDVSLNIFRDRSHFSLVKELLPLGIMIIFCLLWARINFLKLYHFKSAKR